ncbi:MAG: hypothetical protein U9R32_07320 [Bacteroidota bacterium]|nr:hypothetical protein [Bacteroidota bacterium]
MNNPKKLYSDIFDDTGVELAVFNRKNKKMTVVRGLSFLFSIVPLFIFLPNKPFVAAIAFTVFIVIFIFSIVKQTKYRNRMSYLNAKHNFVEKELDALDGDVSSFYDGKQYSNGSHEYSGDLDLFGKKSLFQFINRAVTNKGRVLFSDWLKNPTTEKENIIQRQKAISELSEKASWIVDYYATAGTDIDDKKTGQIMSWLKQPSFFLDKKTKIISNIITLITFILFGFTVFGYVSTIAFVMYLFLVPLGYSSLKVKKVNDLHQQVSKTEENLQLYSKLIKKIEEEEFGSDILAQLKNNLSSENGNASQSINKLAKLSSAFDNRLNIFVGIIINAFLLWDIRLSGKLELWKERHCDNFPKWMETLNTFDAYNGLGLFAFNNPAFIYPKINNSVIIDAEEVGHIFISEKNRVGNTIDIKSQKQFRIITGANMAGKSTYLRTIGTNLLLAMTGVPVCATKFDFSPIKIFTSMRTDDSLQSDESYFYAELKRLKQMIDMLNSGEQLFIILDEILKGTNSKDKQKGSFALVKQLITMNAVGLIATHDLALGNLMDEFPDNIKNKCFEVDTIDDKLKFTYLIRDGVAHNMNATYLMRKMGITI